MLSDPSKSTSKTRHQKAAGVVGGNLPYHLYCLRCPRLAIGFLVASLSLRMGAGVVGGNLPYHLYCLRCPRPAFFFQAIARLLVFALVGFRAADVSVPRC
jgi:hypothetical protein